MRKVAKILGDMVFVLVIVAMLGGSLLFALNQNPNKTLLGYRAYNVLSGSMEPELSKGDLVIVRAVPAEELQNGDIVTYYPTDGEGTTVTHRVVNTLMKDGQVFIETKGDAVEQADPMFPGDAVIGVVALHIPLLGAAISWVQTHLVLSAAIVVLALTAWTGVDHWRKKAAKGIGKDARQVETPHGK